MSLNCRKRVGAAGGERSTAEESDEMFLLDEEKTAQILRGECQNVWPKHRSNGNPINCWEAGLGNHRARRPAVTALGRTLPLVGVGKTT